MTTTFVSMSFPRYVSNDSSWISDLLPSDINAEKPRPDDSAQSVIATAIAPDCETKATDPFSGNPSANEEVGGDLTINGFAFGFMFDF